MVGHSLAATNARQAVVTVAVAVLVAGSALAAGAAYDRWQAAGQEELRWTTAASAALRQVYVTEAPFALTIAMANVRADSLEESAKAAGPAGELAVVDAEAKRFWVRQLLESTGSGNSLVAEDYFRPGAGFDVAARLSDYAGSDSENILVSRTAELLDSGDEWWAVAEILASGVIAVVLLYLLLEILDARMRRRIIIRYGLNIPPGSDDVGLVPRPWSQRSGRLVMFVAFVAWLLVGTLPWVQLNAEGIAARTATMSSIELAKAAAGTGGAAHVLAFRDVAEATVLLAEMEANGALYALAPAIAGIPTTVEENAIVVQRADNAALQGIRTVAERMSRLPNELDGIEPALARLALSGPMQWNQSAIEHGVLLETSANATSRANLLATALLLATLVLVLTEIALTASGSRSALIRYCGVLVLLAAWALTGVSLVG